MSTKAEKPARVDSSDPRAARVRDSLRQAAFQLILERRVERISVSDIAELAGVSRQVFYQHFRDRDDAVAKAVAASFRDMSVDGDAEENPSAVIHQLCDFTARHATLYRNLYPSAASQQTADAYRDLLRPACVRLVEDLLAARGSRGDAVTTAALADFVLGGIIEVIRLRVETPAPGATPTAEDLRDQIDACLTTVVSA